MGANAQTSVWTFTAGQTLTAAQMNDTARTGVPVFATTATRDAAFGGTGEKTLAEGQMCYIEAAPKRLQVYNGTAWLDYDIETTSFTPTISGYTRGNGTSVAFYQRQGKFTYATIRETLGTTSSVTGQLIFTLPTTAARASSVFGTIVFADTGVNGYLGQLQPNGTTTVISWVGGSAGAYVNVVATSATVPHTWGNTDFFELAITYEQA